MPLLIKAIEKEGEDKLFALWNGLYPLMITGQMSFKSFDDYKSEVFKPITKTTERTSEQIMQEFEKVIKQHEGR